MPRFINRWKIISNHCSDFFNAFNPAIEIQDRCVWLGKKEKPDSSAKNLGESFSHAILLEEYVLSIYLMCTKSLRYLGKKIVLNSNLIRIEITRKKKV